MCADREALASEECQSPQRGARGCVYSISPQSAGPRTSHDVQKLTRPVYDRGVRFIFRRVGSGHRRSGCRIDRSQTSILIDLPTGQEWRIVIRYVHETSGRIHIDMVWETTGTDSTANLSQIACCSIDIKSTKLIPTEIAH